MACESFYGTQGAMQGGDVTEKACLHCRRLYTPRNNKGLFCSDRCRLAAWQAKKRREARAPLERILVGLPARLEELAAEIREALGGKEEA